MSLQSKCTRIIIFVDFTSEIFLESFERSSRGFHSLKQCNVVIPDRPQHDLDYNMRKSYKLSLGSQSI